MNPDSRNDYSHEFQRISKQYDYLQSQALKQRQSSEALLRKPLRASVKDLLKDARKEVSDYDSMPRHIAAYKQHSMFRGDPDTSQSDAAYVFTGRDK